MILRICHEPLRDDFPRISLVRLQEPKETEEKNYRTFLRHRILKLKSVISAGGIFCFVCCLRLCDILTTIIIIVTSLI